MSERVFCIVCGTPICWEDGWPSWMRHFRAVYTEDALDEVWDPTVPARLSGIGQREYYSDVLPADDTPGARTVRITLYYASLEGRMTTLPSPLNPTAQGFPMHDHCWQILVAARPSEHMDMQQFLHVLLSFPFQGGGVNFGHDYGGVAQYDELGDPGRVAAGNDRPLANGYAYLYPRSDPLDIPALRRFFENPVSFHAEGVKPPPRRLYDNPTKADVFSLLPEETLGLLFRALPSINVAGLRRASRTCANTPLRDSFWRTRFLPGYEFEYIFEAAAGQNSAAIAGRWESLYLLARVNQESAEFVSRRRVWGLACSLLRVLDTAAKAHLRGVHTDAVTREFCVHADVGTCDCWATASRDLHGLDKTFSEGSRALWARTVAVPQGALVFASCVEIFGIRYISGVRLVCENGEESDLGYIHAVTPLSQARVEIAGFHLSQDERGVRGISVLSSTGDLSNWAGDSENIPKRRLVLAPKHGVIRYLKGGFDGLKMVYLSISSGARHTKEKAPIMPLRDSAVWYPDIPDPFYSVIGIDPPDHDRENPITIALFGGSKAKTLSKVSRISVRFVVEDGQGEALLGLKVSFSEGLESTFIGVETGKHVRDSGDAVGAVMAGIDGIEEDEEGEADMVWEEEMTFDIDGENGERIVGIDKICRSQHARMAIRVRTNRGRAAEFPPPNPEEATSRYLSVNPIQPQNGVVVGFCSKVDPLSGLEDIGLICIRDTDNVKSRS